MTVLVTGADGQLGRALRELLPDARFHDLDLDITSRSSLDGCDWTGVTAVVNAAAWTAVDAAEQQPLAAWDVNATGVAQLADQARRRDLTLVQVSTDYVLGGEHTGPAPVGAALDPLGAYGVGKAAGELAPGWRRGTTWCGPAGCSATGRTSCAPCWRCPPSATR